MSLPPWAIEFLSRSLDEVATRSGKPEIIEKIKLQATEVLQDLPQSAARGIDAVLQTAKNGKKSVERWSRKQTQQCRPLLNGSGALFQANGCGVEVAGEVLEAGCEILLGGHSRDEIFRQRLDSRLQSSIDSFENSSDYRITVAANLDSAVASLSLLQDQISKGQEAPSDGLKLMIHRSDALRLPSGDSVPDVLNTLVGAGGLAGNVTEIGSADRRDSSDFPEAPNACVVSVDLGQFGGGPFKDLPADAIQVCIAPFHTLAMLHQEVGESTASPADASPPMIESAEKLLNDGVAVVVMTGTGLLNGPESGIIIGQRHLIEQIESTSAWRLLKANDAVLAMTAETLRRATIAADSDWETSETIGTAEMSPMDLINVSEENLKVRAERLATRLSGCDSISAIQIVDADAMLVPGGRYRIGSRQLQLSHSKRDAEQWQMALVDEIPSLLCSVDHGKLCVDLRWIHPAQDALLAEVLER